MRTTVAELDDRGYAIAPRIIDPREVATVARAIDRLALRGAGTRNLLARPWCRALVQRIKGRLASADVFPASFVAVQCTLFDKTAEHNWLVALHQDLSIPVRARVDRSSLGAWSRKEGAHFVQPPSETLERLLAVRVHIDDCGSANGPLRVVPGSHTVGRLSSIAAMELRAKLGEAPCLAKSGDALLMRPLLLHASSKAQAPSRRRVVHMLFGPPALPHGLQWKHAV
jgi:ectoine hydroxylase-related dioxygenase (phytanoyl-CoA dioxygenase family)